MTTFTFLRRFSLVLVSTLALAGGVSQPAAASPRCPAESLEREFLPWLDLAYYKLAPNGGFESGSSAWSLRGGASVVSGNEPFYVGAAGDQYSLSLPSGSSATASATCVTTLDGTIRFFAKNSGSLLSTLKVEVLYVDALGTPRAHTVALLAGSSRWQPTLPILTLANLLHPPLFTDGKVDVAFRFTPLGSMSGWRIDDVYVDPFKAR